MILATRDPIWHLIFMLPALARDPDHRSRQVKLLFLYFERAVVDTRAFSLRALWNKISESHLERDVESAC